MPSHHPKVNPSWIDCKQILVSTIFFVLLVVIPAHAQSDQTTITDIENNPVAQDILEKIEETKKWITELEEKQANLILKNNELEAKRAQAKSSLENDLQQWENLWNEYSSENVFAKFVDTIQVNSTKAVFLDHYDFTQAKVQAGRDAFSQTINNGGDFQEAYAAYLKAAEIKRIEMIQVNSMFNVMHGLAYYNQQILFNPNGEFDLELSGEQLRKYYEDFRINPQYLLANPDDDASREALGISDSSTECRVGYVLVHRYNEDDYVCVTEQTAEMWQRHKMGIAIDRDIQVNLDTMNIQQMTHDRIQEKVASVNSKIQKMHDINETKKDEMKKKYDLMVMNMEVEQKGEEEKILAKLANDKISTKNFTEQMEDTRSKYNELEKTMIKEKFQILEIIDKSFKQELNLLVDRYNEDLEMNIIWDSNRETYNAIMST